MPSIWTGRRRYRMELDWDDLEKHLRDREIREFVQTIIRQFQGRRRDAILSAASAVAGQYNLTTEEASVIAHQTARRISNMKSYYDHKEETGSNRQVSAQNSRAFRLGIAGVLTIEEWDALCKARRYRCAICRQVKPLVIDHIRPLSRGGENNINNGQPLCVSCNSSKGATWANDKRRKRAR